MENRKLRVMPKWVYIVIASVLAVLVISMSLLGGFYWGQENIKEVYGINTEEFENLMWLKDKIQSEYYYDISDEEFYEACFDGINENLLDNYSEYMNEEQLIDYVNKSRGSNVGLGVSFYDTSTLKIGKVVFNSPAEKAGLKSGMYIRGVGTTVDNITDVVATTGTKYDAFFAIVSNIEKSTPFYIATSTTLTGEITVFTVTKELYQRTYVKFATRDKTYSIGSADYSINTSVTESEGMDNLPAGTMYLKLDEFMGRASDEFYTAMVYYRELGCTKLILDIRNNGGGQVSILNEIASYLLKDTTEVKNLVGYAVFKNGKKSNFYATQNLYSRYFSTTTSIKVLANANSASASEALLGAMLDYGTISYGDIYLTKVNNIAKTYGKGIMQSTQAKPLSNVAVKLTTAQIYWPISNNCIHDRGIIEADGCKTNVSTSFAEYGDPELNTFISSAY